MVNAMRLSWMHAIAAIVGLYGVACAQIMGMEAPEVVDSLPDSGEGGAGQGGGGQGGTGGGGTSCDPLQAPNACAACAYTDCCADLTKCTNDIDCANEVNTCLIPCVETGTLQACFSTCQNDLNGPYVSLRVCLTGHCGAQCTGGS
jgi:hypothetical protein